MASQQLERAGGSRARTLVRAAIARGDLAHPKTLVCADCGAPAAEYEHRDYNRPLDVEPICNSCNQSRGPAIEASDCFSRMTGNGVGFVVTKGFGVSHVKFRYVDFGVYEEADLLEAA